MTLLISLEDPNDFSFCLAQLNHIWEIWYKLLENNIHDAHMLMLFGLSCVFFLLLTTSYHYIMYIFLINSLMAGFLAKEIVRLWFQNGDPTAQ